MKVKDFSDYRAPTRRPWLWVVLVVVAGFFLVSLLRGCGKASPVAAPGGDTRATGVVAVPTETGASAAVALSAGEFSGVTREIDDLIAADDLLNARTRLLAALAQGGDDGLRHDIERRLGDVNMKLVTTPRRMPEKQDYVVRRGDSIERIARQFGTTVELVQAGNGITNPNLIKAGDRLRVLQARFTVQASKSRHDLVVSMNGAFFKRYRTGTGLFGKTPIGTFVIRDKIAQPVWWRPDGKEIPYGDPENILGTHWLSLRATGDTEDVRGYGIHGTKDDSSIGKASSAGCLRMHNADIEQLFMVLPVGTEVTILE